MNINQEIKKLKEQNRATRIKRPKAPKSWRYPRLYARNIEGTRAGRYEERYRIVYPDGTAEWATGLPRNFGSSWGYKPCWNGVEHHENPEKAIRDMRKYDRQHGFLPPIFIGEIK